MTSDPIADMLTRLRNGAKANREVVNVPASRMKRDLARVLQREGFLTAVDETAEGVRRMLHLRLKYAGEGEPVLQGLKRISRPGCRRYAGSDHLPRVRSGIGMAVLTTSAGLMTDREARRKGIGGEVICQVW
jgi:small subunit ribosomal protein S8